MAKEVHIPSLVDISHYVIYLILQERKRNINSQSKKSRIVDGDTIRIDKTKYRLHGIDAPEINQQCKVNEKSYACGLQSKIFLESLAQGKEIMCKQRY